MQQETSELISRKLIVYLKLREYLIDLKFREYLIDLNYREYLIYLKFREYLIYLKFREHFKVWSEYTTCDCPSLMAAWRNRSKATVPK